MFYDIWYGMMDLLRVFRRDIILVVGILLSLPFKRAREFIRYWGPFFLLWIVYDMFRGIADNLGHIHIKPVYYAELWLFGWIFGGKIPAFYFADHQDPTLTAFTAFIYTLHPLIPMLLGAVVFYISKNKKAFQEFSYSFLLTVYMALLTFLIFPVAPPWYIEESGFVQPHEFVGVRASAARLVNVDGYFKGEFYGTVYGTFNANPYAAMPSLHSGFAVVSVYYLIRIYGHKSKWLKLAWIYPALVWFSAVYLNHHYILDLIAGASYAIIASKIVQRVLARHWANQADEGPEELEKDPEGPSSAEKTIELSEQSESNNQEIRGSEPPVK